MTDITEIIEQVEQESVGLIEARVGYSENIKPHWHLAAITKQVGETATTILEGNSLSYRDKLVEVAAAAIAAIHEFDTASPMNINSDTETVVEYKRALT